MITRGLAGLSPDVPRSKTHCHDNFGYGARKHLIRCDVFSENVGPQCALKG